MYERILVVIDGTVATEELMSQARAQALAFRAAVVLVQVVSPSSLAVLVPFDASGTIVSDSSAMTTVVSAEAEARSYLEGLAVPLRQAELSVSVSVRLGTPAEEVLAEAAEKQVGLILIGAPDRGASRRSGVSVADTIAHQALCSVLFVRAVLPRSLAASLPEVQRGHVRSFWDDAEIVGPLAPKPLGTRTVELARIVGSVGRAQELTGDFRPLGRRQSDDQRYDRIFRAFQRGDALPPVELYKLGYNYYVLDGNHRVAAARQLGQVDIDALVTEFVKVDDEDEQRVFVERRSFERHTGLFRVGASRPGHYVRLEQLIREYASEVGMAEEAEDETIFKEAAKNWYSNIFYPVAQRIRAARLRDYFPDHRTADIFVHLADFRESESRLERRMLPWNEALDRFISAYGRPRPDVLERLPGLRWLLRGLGSRASHGTSGQGQVAEQASRPQN